MFVGRGSTIRGAAIASLYLLAACGSGEGEPLSYAGGGGGGGGTGPDVSFDCTGTTEFDAEFEIGGNTYCTYGPGMIHADAAYAAGATGAGVTVAVIDTGIDTTHPELDANISSASYDVVRDEDITTLTDEDGHGTNVAGIIAAEKNGVWNHGVAYNATILAVRADTRITNEAVCGNAEPCSVFSDADIVLALDYATANGANVINLSLGSPDAPIDGSIQQALIDAMAAGAIVVAATGNESAAQPSYPAAYAGDAAVNISGQMIAVGAVDATGAQTIFSNDCGIAMNFCLMAPGDLIVSTWKDGGLAAVSGTSQATPFVAGAAALLIELWPTLLPEEVVDILLTTATDLGTSGVDPVYGRGLLNLESAMAPAGALAIPTSAVADGDAVTLDGTRLSLGPAFGDALSNSALLSNAFALDDYERNYAVDLQGYIQRPERGFGLSALLGDRNLETVDAELPNGMKVAMGVADPDEAKMAADWTGMAADDTAQVEEPELHGLSFEIAPQSGIAIRLGYDTTPEQQVAGLAGDDTASLFWMPGDLLGPQQALVGAGTGFSISRNLGQASSLSFGWTDQKDDPEGLKPDSKIGELHLAHRFRNGAIGYLGFSIVSERDGFLGSEALGGFAVAGAETRFYSLGGRYPMPAGTELVASYTLGEAEMTADGTGLLGQWSNLRADSFGLGLVKKGLLGTGDRIGLLAGQPLRVASGEATVTAPVDYLADKTVVQGAERVSTTPSGREIDLQIAYAASVFGSAAISGWLMMQLQPGHVADADPAYGAGIRFSTDF